MIKHKRSKERGISVMGKAYLYLRVSSPTQVDGSGFGRQEEVCRAFAKKAGYEIAGGFQEAGVSGVMDETQRTGKTWVDSWKLPGPSCLSLFHCSWRSWR